MKGQRWKDFWTLHVPLVLVTALVIYATIKQYNRAMEGNGRSWVYLFQWPIIGLFAIVVWNRYRKHGNLTQWFTRHYRERAERFTAEAEAQERAEKEQWANDPDAQAWAEYQRTLREQDRSD
ncbi:MAG: hypothetical protein RJB01_1793 [Actinomycetota bacterium]